jgi:hypothetical protein
MTPSRRDSHWNNQSICTWIIVAHDKPRDRGAKILARCPDIGSPRLPAFTHIPGGQQFHYQQNKLLFELNSETSLKYFCPLTIQSIRDSSVGIALSYELNDRGSRVRFPAVAGNFSLYHRVQTGSWAHPASYPMGTRGYFSGGKVAGAWSWPLTSSWCRGQRMSGAIPPLPNKPSWRGAQLKQRDTFIFTFTIQSIAHLIKRCVKFHKNDWLPTAVAFTAVPFTRTGETAAGFPMATNLPASHCTNVFVSTVKSACN